MKCYFILNHESNPDARYGVKRRIIRIFLGLLRAPPKTLFFGKLSVFEIVESSGCFYFPVLLEWSADLQGTLPIFSLLIRGDEALEGILRCFGGLSFQEGIAVHIVDQVAEAVVLTRSFQSDAADVVHSHLLHAPEDVFHSHSDPPHSFVEALIGFAQRIIAVGFAH